MTADDTQADADTQDTGLEATDALAADLEIDVADDDGAADLSPREALFVYAYGDTESKHFGKRTDAARAAGYSGARSAGLKLVKRPRIKASLATMHEAAAASMGHVMANLEHIRLLAEKKGDLRVACRAAELQGKHLAAFSDVVIDIPARREYSEWELAEIMRLSNLLLREDAEREHQALEGALPDALEGQAPAGGDGNGNEGAGTPGC